MNALLLAAGYATRLYPLTLHTPKPLLPVAGKPIAGYMVEQLAEVPAIGRLLVVTNHRFASHFEAWAREDASRFDIEVVDDGTDTNETRLGAIGDVAFTLARYPELAREPLFVLGVDNLVDFRLGDLADDFTQRGGGSTVICLTRESDPAQLRRSGVVTLGEDDRVVGFVEKPQEPPSDLTCPPFYVYPPGALALIGDYLAAGESADAPGNFIAWLHTRALVYGHVFEQRRYDVGTPETYAEACRLFEARAAGAARRA
ncbi:MAG TPA: nucleotidyltransferase family protein [Chloroflexota bacterium]|nr:nucleotidyltransferase family protein [Chloroflexota bacterium]